MRGANLRVDSRRFHKEVLRDKRLMISRLDGRFAALDAHAAGERKGVRVVRLSTKPRHDTFERRTSPRGRVYYWPDWRQLEDDEEGTDVWAFVRGYITVTPMTLDATAPDEIKGLRWLESK